MPILTPKMLIRYIRDGKKQSDVTMQLSVTKSNRGSLYKEVGWDIRSKFSNVSPCCIQQVCVNANMSSFRTPGRF